MAQEVTEKTFWDFCDNYLEIVKGRAYDTTDKSAVSALMLTLDTFTKLFAPFCPFITEEVHQSRSWGQSGSLHKEKWPNASDFEGIKDNTTELYDNLVYISGEIRKHKTSANESMRTPISDLELSAPDNILDTLKQVQTDIINVGSINQGAIKYTSGTSLSVNKIVLEAQEK